MTPLLAPLCSTNQVLHGSVSGPYISQDDFVVFIVTCNSKVTLQKEMNLPSNLIVLEAPCCSKCVLKLIWLQWWMTIKQFYCRFSPIAFQCRFFPFRIRNIISSPPSHENINEFKEKLAHVRVSPARISASRLEIHSHTFWYAKSNFVAENCNFVNPKGATRLNQVEQKIWIAWYAKRGDLWIKSDGNFYIE